MKREITLSAYIKDSDDPLIQEIKDFCKREYITISKTDFRFLNKDDRFFDFDIVGKTEDFSLLKLKFADKIFERYFAELGNVFDLDKETFEKWTKIILKHHDTIRNITISHRVFLNIINKADTIEKLYTLKKYTRDDFTKLIIDDKIAKISNQKCSFDLYIEKIKERNKIVDILSEVQEDKYELTIDDIKKIKDFLIKL